MWARLRVYLLSTAYTYKSMISVEHLPHSLRSLQVVAVSERRGRSARGSAWEEVRLGSAWGAGSGRELATGSTLSRRARN